MFTFRSPCVVGWNLKDREKLSSDMIEYMLTQFVQNKILSVRVDFGEGLLKQDDIYKLFIKAKEAGIGFEWNLSAENIDSAEMKRIDHVCEYINFLIRQDSDVQAIYNCIQDSAEARRRIHIIVQRDNINSLNGIIANFVKVSNQIDAIYCEPRYSPVEDESILSQDEVDDFSIDLIDLAEEFEESFHICYKDGSDEIRCLLSEKTVANSIYIESNGDVCINEWFHITFGNIGKKSLKEIWDTCKDFWFNDKVKVLFSGFTSLYQSSRMECCMDSIPFHTIT